MKAIVNLKNGSFKEVNGLTFEVTEINESFISLKGANLEWPKNSVDFKHDEVIIVDIVDEFRKISANKNMYAQSRQPDDWTRSMVEKKYRGLLEYIRINNIKNHDW